MKREQTKKGVPVQDTPDTQKSSPVEASGEIDSGPEEVSGTTDPPLETVEEPASAQTPPSRAEDDFYSGSHRGESMDDGSSWVPPEDPGKPRTALWVVLALLVAGILAFTGIYLGSRGMDTARSARNRANNADKTAYSAELKAQKAEEAVKSATSKADAAKKVADGFDKKIGEAVKTAAAAKKVAMNAEKWADEARDMARKANSKADDASATAESNLKRLDKRKECLDRVCKQPKKVAARKKKKGKRRWRTPRKWRKAKKRRRATTRRPNSKLEKRVSRLERDMYHKDGKVPRLERKVAVIKRDLDEVNNAQAAYQRHLNALREEFRGFRDSNPSR